MIIIIIIYNCNKHINRLTLCEQNKDYFVAFKATASLSKRKHSESLRWTGSVGQKHLMGFERKVMAQEVSLIDRWLSRYSDSLRAGRSEERTPVGARLSAAVQTGPGTHNGYRVAFPE